MTDELTPRYHLAELLDAVSSKYKAAYTRSRNAHGTVTLTLSREDEKVKGRGATNEEALNELEQRAALLWGTP